MRLSVRWVVLGTMLSSGMVIADHKVALVPSPAQVRLPEQVFLLSSPSLVRSNSQEEFVALDEDSSFVFEPTASANNADVLVQQGLVLPLESNLPSPVLPVSSEQDVVVQAPAVDVAAALPGSLLDGVQELPAQTSSTADEADAILESQWIINPEPNDYLSIDSREAKSLLEYVKKTCDDPAASVRLSLNGRDVLAFITMARRYKFDALAIDAGLRCFYNKFKSCMVIDDAVLHQVLPELVSLLEGYLDYEKNVSMAIGAVQRDVEQLMCECFVKYSHMLSTRPNDFLTKLSRMVARSAYMSLESDETALARSRHDRDRLRSLTIQLVNLLLDRVVWPPHAFESIWPSFVRIGTYICDFAQKNVITHMDDFKDLHATLTQRFIFYINLHAPMLPSDFFRVIQNDLSMGAVFFLEYDEHADLKKTFERELNAALIKSLAYERTGIGS